MSAISRYKRSKRGRKPSFGCRYSLKGNTGWDTGNQSHETSFLLVPFMGLLLPSGRDHLSRCVPFFSKLARWKNPKN